MSCHLSYFLFLSFSSTVNTEGLEGPRRFYGSFPTAALEVPSEFSSLFLKNQNNLIEIVITNKCIHIVLANIEFTNSISEQSYYSFTINLEKMFYIWCFYSSIFTVHPTIIWLFTLLMKQFSLSSLVTSYQSLWLVSPHVLTSSIFCFSPLPVAWQSFLCGGVKIKVRSPFTLLFFKGSVL